MVSISKDIKNILCNARKELLEECTADICRCHSKIVNYLETHFRTSLDHTDIDSY